MSPAFLAGFAQLRRLVGELPLQAMALVLEKRYTEAFPEGGQAVTRVEPLPENGVHIAIVSKGRVLLMLRSELPVWCLPGGRIEAGESAEQAAVREAAEETGLQVELLRRVGSYERPQWPPRGDRVALFAARPTGGRLHPADGEAKELRYFAPNALPEDLIYLHRRRIEDALSGRSGVQLSQPFTWPFKAGSYRELIESITRGEQDEREVVKALTRAQ
ncbi:MAG: NUDIX domain-containing protein [Myxococcales bacterium]|nr:NUDIX domain-containing protein [Myxococcales bacterium]MDD9965803.1 NUDIX domain-containing protein [Myxococcales bacterium]